MKVKCAECGKRYRIKDSLVAPAGIKVRCPNCNFIIPIYPEPIVVTHPGTSSSDVSQESTESTNKIESEETTPFSNIGETPTMRGMALSEEEELDESLIQRSHADEYESTHVQSETDKKPLVSKREENSLPGFSDPTYVGTDGRQQLENSLPDDSSQAMNSDADISLHARDESSLPGEISQISFDSDATFKDIEERVQRSADAKDSKKSKGESTRTPIPKKSQAATAINPNKPSKRADFSEQVADAVVANPSEEEPMPTPTPTHKRFERSRGLGFSWRSFAIGVGVVCLGIYAVRGNRLFKQPAPEPQSTPVAVAPTASPTAAVVPTTVTQLAETQQAIVNAALTHLTKPALEYAASTIAQTSQPSTSAWLAYLAGLSYLFYGDTTARDKGLAFVSRALLENTDDTLTILASGLLNREAATLNKALDKLTDLNRQTGIGGDQIAFLQSVQAHVAGDDTTALQAIRSALEQRPAYGPYVGYALQLSTLPSSDRQELQRLLQDGRERIAARYPEFSQFTDKAPSTTAKSTPTAVPTPKLPRTAVKPPKPTTSKQIIATPSKGLQLKELLAQADQSYKREQYNDALAQYQAAQKIAGDRDAVVLIRTGYAWFKLYRLDEAYNHFNRAIQIDANQADAHKGLGMVYDQLGDLEKAAREYALYLQLKPNAADAAEIRELLKKLKP